MRRIIVKLFCELLCGSSRLTSSKSRNATVACSSLSFVTNATPCRLVCVECTSQTPPFGLTSSQYSSKKATKSSIEPASIQTKSKGSALLSSFVECPRNHRDRREQLDSHWLASRFEGSSGKRFLKHPDCIFGRLGAASGVA